MHRKWLGWTAALCLVAACGRYGWIGTEAQAPFRRCVCSHPACTARQSAMAEEYATLDERERTPWLAEQGCDPSGYRLSRYAGSGYARPTTPTPRTPLAAPTRGRGRVTVSTEHDEFTGETTHRLRVEINSRERLTVLADGSGRGDVTVLVSSHNDSWTYLECHSVAALADSERLSPYGVDHDGSVLRGGVAEHVVFRFAPHDVRTMALARRIRFRICNTVYELPHGSAAAFGELYRRAFGMPVQPDVDGRPDAGVEAAPLEPPE